ncbi:hypothetical protein AWM70_21100 [Paenibacillus yonginensis]|uniref:Uncharacterized protein n=1 Tax=Paenibacillus yonginensis TaxID=1462996 RepID=A0A1B1N5U0_9BACL|nr:hypothetical protein [Paenibacillus yonginensis]ANS76772.1 hypothetical protein AWM70_21100 [Paenibacillus yonginensis]
MFLTDGLYWIDHYPLRAAVLLAAIILFAWLYVAAQRIWRRSDETRLDRLRESLERYADAEYEIRRKLNQEHAGSSHSLDVMPEEDTELAGRLLACQAAPYVSPGLREQIGVYMRRRDSSRLEPILRVMTRESGQLTDEYEALLHNAEQPGWGSSLIRLIRPALPFVLLSAGIALGIWLARDLSMLAPDTTDEYGWTVTCLIARTVSGLFSLLMLGQVLLVNRRPSRNGGLRILLALIIAALFAVHSAGLAAAPYALALQILIFPLGFWNQGRSRRSRPFAGHYELARTDGGTSSSAPLISSGSELKEEDNGSV